MRSKHTADQRILLKRFDLPPSGSPEDTRSSAICALHHSSQRYFHLHSPEDRYDFGSHPGLLRGIPQVRDMDSPQNPGCAAPRALVTCLVLACAGIPDQRAAVFQRPCDIPVPHAPEPDACRVDQRIRDRCDCTDMLHDSADEPVSFLADMCRIIRIIKCIYVVFLEGHVSMCMPFPLTPVFGFGINVACSP